MTSALVSQFIIIAFRFFRMGCSIFFFLILVFFSSEAYSTLDQRERRHTLDETTDTLAVLKIVLVYPHMLDCSLNYTNP